MSGVYFLSLVSSEFHRADPARERAFVSYRDMLARYLRREVPGCRIVVQEELAQGPGDLLDTLDREVGGCTAVIHVVGDAAGHAPTPAEVRRVRERHPDFPAREPELAALVGDGAGITYTQWEAYLAFQHGRGRLVFTATGEAPRSPAFAPTDDERASQERHRRRLKGVGEHRQECHGPSDLVHKSLNAIERHGLNPTRPAAAPDPERADAANRARDEIVAAFVGRLRASVKVAVTEYDPVGRETFLKALDPIVAEHGLTRRFVQTLIEEGLEARRRAAGDDPTPENLYDLAFAEMASGHYHDAIVAARRYAEAELLLTSTDPDRHDDHLDRALSGHLLWKEAAQLAGLRGEAMRALEAAARLVEKDREPVLWADVHEEIATHHLESARYDLARPLVDEVIDVREEHQPEPSSALAHTLLTWCKLLKHDANWAGMASVAARAERMFAAASPPDVAGTGASLNERAVALIESHSYAEARDMLRRALRLELHAFGPDAPTLLFRYSNLANVEVRFGNLSEAVRLHAEAVRIGELRYPGHPFLAGAYALSADCEMVRNNLSEARRLLVMACQIEETVYGPENPNIAQMLGQLAIVELLAGDQRQHNELTRRAHRILVNAYGPEHPETKRASVWFPQSAPAGAGPDTLT